MKAIITGITGQDGSYLAELLLAKGFEVIGVKRRSSTPNIDRIKHLLGYGDFELEEGDISDPHYVTFSLLKHRPNYVFNLAAQSHVHTSFSQPSYTFDVTGKAVLNYLEAIRAVNDQIRFYQASSSEMFGNSVSYYDGGRQDGIYNTNIMSNDIFQDEKTPFNPQSPYAIAKLSAHHLVGLYRKSYGLFACSGILFNHESERRGDLFVTKKITNYIKKLVKGETKNKLYLGNLNAYRDWGHAEDYVRAMLLMLENDTPDDYVIGTGETHSIKDFLNTAFFKVRKDYRDYVAIDKDLFRPAEVPYLKSHPEKAKRLLGWSPLISFDRLVERMLE